MSAQFTRGLAELGRRLSARRGEARLDLAALAERSGVRPSELDAFEAGLGGLGVAALMSVAKALGVPATSFVHTRAPEVRAPVEPSVVLKGLGAAWLRDADRDALANGLRRARDFAETRELVNTQRLSEGFTALPAPEKNSFIAGYDAANKVRALLLRTGPLRSLARLLEDQFDMLVLRHRFADPRVLGAACRSGDARLIAVNVGVEKETTRRFALAHELGHQLLDLDESGVTADELTERGGRAWFEKSPSEKRADAFAAMLLAPAPVVSEVAGSPRSLASYENSKALVERVRAHVGMGFAATTWHLHNLGYVQQGTAETLLLAEPEADPVTGFEEDTRFDGLERRVMAAYARDAISHARARELLGGTAPETLAASL